ncbi:ATP-dependent DNA helicase PIF4 [Artemisia annua]|uniref:ATP-dependent DNA helicase n=1 Tax=Artemisia annua TaxID=35608 RepID=A0A2U1NFV0_ARTAN|nr:ATP-dependent DNA helicase PIF4 [Artemisia annua]
MMIHLSLLVVPKRNKRLRHPLIDEDTDDEFDNIIEDNDIHISDTIEEGTNDEDEIGLEELETNSDESTYEVDDLDNFIDDEDATSDDTDDENNDDLFFNDDNIALYYIEELMRSRGTTLRRWPEVPFLDERYITEFGNRLIYDETDYNPVELQSEYERLYASLTTEQKAVYDTIVNSVDTGTRGVYFVYGYRGTRKMFLLKTLATSIRRKCDIVLKTLASLLI